LHRQAIDRWLAPLVDIPFGLCALNSITLPGLDEAKFHFRHHARNRKNHFAHWAIGRNGGFEDAQEGAFLIELMNEIEDFPSRAPEPIELDAHQHVAGANKFHQCLQLIPALPAFAR